MMTKDGTDPFVMMSTWSSLGDIMEAMGNELIGHYELVIKHIEKTNQKVDSIVLLSFFADNGFYLAHYFNCPMILLSPIGPAPHWSHLFGNPENPSYQPDTVMPFIEPMNFKERMYNSFFYGLMELGQIYGRRMNAELVDSKGLMKFEDYMNMYYNMSLLLQGSHFITHNSRPLVANTIEVGGMHCRKGKELPPDLKNVLDSSPEGVIYVSFGSTIQSSLMSKEHKKVFMETFAQLTHPIIWKWDEDSIPNLPENVILRKWLPQQDLLAHPNLKVFVTHGGLFSIQEALFHSTPLVGIPLGTDQKPNMLRAQSHGYAVMLEWPTLNTTGLSAAINRVMYDSMVKESMDRSHTLFTDQSEPPLEKAIWWVEYVMRHNGADFLKPQSMNLAFYQYNLLDVAGLVFVIVITLLFVFWKFCCYCCKKCCCDRAQKQKIE